MKKTETKRVRRPQQSGADRLPRPRQTKVEDVLLPHAFATHSRLAAPNPAVVGEGGNTHHVSPATRTTPCTIVTIVTIIFLIFLTIPNISIIAMIAMIAMISTILNFFPAPRFLPLNPPAKADPLLHSTFACLAIASERRQVLLHSAAPPARRNSRKLCDSAKTLDFGPLVASKRSEDGWTLDSGSPDAKWATGAFSTHQAGTWNMDGLWPSP
jgi:hypothetical protein